MPSKRTVTVQTLLALLALSVGWQASSTAQEKRDQRLLFLAPRPAQSSDSIFALTLAEEVRDRLDSHMRYGMQVMPTKVVCTLLTQSGYPCRSILSDLDAARLARAMQADVYVTGSLRHEGPVPLMTYHIINIGRSGMSGWQTARGSAGDTPRSFAVAVVDSLQNQARAAEYVRECLDRRDRGDFRDALEQAKKAFALYPNHSLAALCAAVVLEAQQAPIDSQIRMYEKAVKGDSLNDRSWETLGRMYQQHGDSLKALEAFRRAVELNPTDRDRWRAVVIGYLTVKDYHPARRLLDEWLSREPDDLDFLRLKERVCTEGEMWSCALATMSEEYARDSSLVGDTIFYRKIVGAAQVQADTQAVLKWATTAAQRSPNPVPWLKIRVAGLQLLGRTDSAMQVYQRILQLDSMDVAATLSYAQLLADRIVIDSTVPLDTTALLRVESLLDRATTLSRDTGVVMRAAIQYYAPAASMVPLQKRLDVATRMLEKALKNDVLKRLQVNANFFLGWAVLSQVYAFDPKVVEAKSCQMVSQEAEMIRKGKEAMTTGASLAPRASFDFLQRYKKLEERLPDLRRAFCK